ncbi:MAG TPA: carboxypeptidase regulatory-like domain-containing protein, partial [Chitinispirillaceae bacterium]|nr:carboxypeptidase regulatory-like domain-containing protein [Chitinispirillaceae bacterium]
FAISITVYSQPISLSGTVSDAKGRVIVGAHVSLFKKKFTVETDSAGSFRIVSDMSTYTPQCKDIDYIKVKNNNIFLYLTAPSPVRIEQFDFHGKLMKRIDMKVIQPGEYQFEKSGFNNVTAMSAVRILTNSTQKIFRWLSLGNKPLIGNDFSATLSGKAAFSNVATPVDSLKISAGGYSSKTVPLFSYQNASIAVTLDTIRSI